MKNIYIHPTAIVADNVVIGKNTKIWINVQIREGVTLGDNCIISKDVYIDHSVSIGAGCKVQNSVSIYNGVNIDDDVFIGPNVSFTNDLVPRAFNSSWKVTPTYIRKGVSIGANSTIVCGVTLGEYCMVGAGSVVTKDIPPYSLVVGNPARICANIDKDGNKIEIK
jgi:acetyltransferase-like isoleucine patch superfamily enzyme